jgi:hypothetical protein
MKLRLEAILNTYAKKKDEYCRYFPYSEGEILSALTKELRKENFFRYIYNIHSFDGGPGYYEEYFVLTWFEDNNLHSIDWVEECC